jgi:hypothetical protein
MKFLYTAGTARGGTNFRTLMLNNHSNVKMSIDPFIPLFRFYRDSILKHLGKLELLDKVPNRNILDDYYFDNTKLEIMEAIQGFEDDLEFDLNQWDDLKKQIASRMSLASMNLIKNLDMLPASTFKEVFNNMVSLVTAESKDDIIWAGFNDNWTSEFFPLIARLAPDAKFIVHLRDPRSVVHSSEYAEPDPAKHPPIITFARHLRKHYAFASMFKNLKELENRLLITHYEPFLDDPDKELMKITDFLGINFEPGMSNIDKFRKADGSPWPSNKSDYKNSKDVWRSQEYRNLTEVTEFICDPEMRLHGYFPEVYEIEKGLSDGAFTFMIENLKTSLGWNTDFDEIERVIGSEFYRKRVLQTPIEMPKNEIKRLFLFHQVYKKLQNI